ncbi:glucose-6-phosphate dehydrogenase assembly protein OpcA [Bifidobacterium aquikefiri]|uniref:glucose-6-phosphate dehydrogenase assembly protein OpcA n=1 Tax=Bifidobacterium aquikefiri TaxID=1653207 RepID=UPI0039EA3B2E
MIVTLSQTTTSAISSKIENLHKERGEVALGRVLTMLICTASDNLESTLETANEASREHPCRVIAIVDAERNKHEDPRLDAQVRFGADAGAGEIIILKPYGNLTRHLDTLVIPLLVPDAPVVAWWPTRVPEDPSKDALGAMARNRITDALRAPNPEAAFTALRAHWSSQDVDMSWTRLTRWRALAAALLDQPPHLAVVSARVTGQSHYLPVDLLAAWLAVRLEVPVTLDQKTSEHAITGIYLTREDSSVVSIERHNDEDQAMITQAGAQAQAIAMPMRTLEECLSEELRRLDPDEIYAEVINRGWGMIDHD